MRIGLLALLSLAGARGATAQQPPAPKTLTVQEAVAYALEHYPSVRASLESYNAARAQVGLAATNYLPRLDAVWQGNRGTRNSVLGVLLPQSPNILTGTQGTVLPVSSRPFWASGAGVLFSWEPFRLGFGYRRALLRSAQSSANRAAEEITLTRLGVASAVADAALAVLADEQRVTASRADVDRRAVFARSVHALVDAHLRPGADASRADAELAAARTQLILAEETAQVASSSLAEVLGMAGGRVEVKHDPFLETPPENAWAPLPATDHPAVVVEERKVQEAQSRIAVLNHSFYPHFSLEGLTSVRGSGQNSKGLIAPGLNGLGTDVHNWEAGLTISLGLLDYPAIRERKKAEVANRRRQEALYDETVQTVTGQMQQAATALDGARRVAGNTPIELKASRDSEAQARARFQAGVGTIVDVAEAQRLLVQAEIDDSLARLGIWRALADLAAARGSLDPFLSLASHMPAGAP